MGQSGRIVASAVPDCGRNPVKALPPTKGVLVKAGLWPAPSGCDQYVGRNTEPLVKSANHAQRACKHFVDTVAPANHRLEILDAQACLLHTELDGLDRVRRSDGVVLAFPGFDEGDEGLEIGALLAFRIRLLGGIEEGLCACQRGTVVGFGADRMQGQVNAHSGVSTVRTSMASYCWCLPTNLI